MSKFPNPDVIVPASNAPDSTRFAHVVIAACVPPVTVAAVVAVSALPVTAPVSGPAKPVAV